MTNPPQLLALATAVPKYVLSQDNVADTARHIFGTAGIADLDRMVAVFGNAGIDTRYSTVSAEWYEQKRGWTDRNTLYLENALALRLARWRSRNDADDHPRPRLHRGLPAHRGMNRAA